MKVITEKKQAAYIAFQGGGALGMAHLGAWQEVSQKFNIIGTAGTSAGSIVAAFCAAGYTPRHTLDIFYHLNWSKYVNRQIIWKLLLRRDAYSDGKRFHKWLQENFGSCFSDKPQDITFAELYQFSHIYLAIVACDLNSQSGHPVVFDKETEPSTTVSFAVRASISIPGLFTPMSRLSQRQELVDGGLLLNFPIEILQLKGQDINCPVIGVRFKQPLNYLESPRVLQVAKATIDLMMRRGSLPPDYIALNPNYIDVEIDISDFNPLNFSLTRVQKEELVRRGSYAARLALSQYEARIRQQDYAWRPVDIDKNSPLSKLKSQAKFNQAYVKREPIESLCYREVFQPGALIRIKAPLQMGKTFLMSRILEHAAKYSYRTIALNLREATPEDFSTLDNFLQWFCTSITVKQGLNQSVDEHWSQSLGNSKIKCRTYFEKYILPGNSPLTLAIDEVDKLFPYVEIAGDFLGMLRTWHEDAKIRDLWKQIRLIVLHTEVYTQVDINQSPFNAGTEIKLVDFNQEQVQNLAKQYQIDWDINHVKQLMNIVGGHPYLVRRAIDQVAQQYLTFQQLLQSSANEDGIYSDHLRQHLNKLKNSPKLAEAFKKLVLTNVALELNSELDPDIAVKLDNLGLVKLQSNKAMPRYELYRQYFRNFL